MVQYTIELVIIDDRFINSTGIAALGSNITRQTIKKGEARDLETARYDAGLIWGEFEPNPFPTAVARKYTYHSDRHILHSEHKYSSSLIVTYRVPNQKN